MSIGWVLLMLVGLLGGLAAIIGTIETKGGWRALWAALVVAGALLFVGSGIGAATEHHERCADLGGHLVDIGRDDVCVDGDGRILGS